MRLNLRSSMAVAALVALCGWLPASAWGQAKAEPAPAPAPAPAHAAPAPVIYGDHGPCCMPEPCCGHDMSFFGFVDYLHWRAHRNTAPFSGTITFITDQPNVDTGSYSIVAADSEYDWDSGWRLAVGVKMGAMEIGFQYTSFDTNGSLSLGDPANDVDLTHANLLDRSLVDEASLNGLFDDGIVDAASQSISIDYDVYDIWMGTEYKTCDYLALKPFIGFRYADISQSETVLYTNTEPGEIAPDTDTYDLTRTTDLKGYGLRGGLAAESNLCGLGFFARSAVSLLYTEFDTLRTDAAFNQSAGDVEIRSWANNFNTVTPVLEVAAGVSFSYHNFTLAGGYEFTHWFNIQEHADVPGWDDVDEETPNYRPDRGDISFDGFFIRAGVSY
jgi:hypothetical protein